MKSHTNLWPRVTSFENLYGAFRRARLGKRSRPDVAAFELDLERRHLFELQRELVEETYRPGGYRSFVIYEPARRKISAAPFRDRVVHHALCAVVEPLFDRVFLPHSFANRIGRGTHRALARCQDLLRRHPYVLKADISRCFPSIDHEILGRLLTRRLRCPPTRRLIRLILASGAGILVEEYEMTWFPGDTLLSPLDRARGLPIGNLTSQFWANVYLHELDRFVVRELRHDAYIRYVDDVVLFGATKSELQHAREQIAAFLPRLRLTLHPRKTQVLPATAGLPFLGFSHTPGRMRLLRASVERFRRRLRRQAGAFAAGGLAASGLSASVRSWVAHASHGQTYRLRAQLLGALRVSRSA